MGKSLKYHRNMSALVFGTESPATKYLDEEIVKYGEDEEVLAPESQLIQVLISLHRGETDATGDNHECANT